MSPRKRRTARELAAYRAEPHHLTATFRPGEKEPPWAAECSCGARARFTNYGQMTDSHDKHRGTA